jgi:hypothetical protein
MNNELIISKLKERGMELDSQDTLFLSRQLEKIETETYDVLFPELQYKTLVPVVVTNEPYADTITYRQYTPTGQAKIISDYSDDLPNVGKFQKEFSRPVKALGDAFSYSWEEVEKAIKLGMNLSSELAMVAREKIEQKVDDLVLLGDSDLGIEGFYDLTGTQSYTVAADGTGSVKTWFSAGVALKTPLNIVRDISNTITLAATGTKGVESGVNTFLLPLSHFAWISTTPMSSDNNSTILDYVKKSFPMVDFMPAYKLAGILGDDAGERLIAYNRAARKVKMNITSPFRQMPPQAKNLAFDVPCVAKIAGTVTPYPMSIVYADGV